MMNTAELIYEKSKNLPESVAHQVLDYLDFLESRYFIPANNSNKIKPSEKTELELAYEAMSNDNERENEALTWCNSLIGDNDAAR